MFYQLKYIILFMMKTLSLILLCISLNTVKAQIVPADTVPAIINYTTENGVTKFSSILRPLRQIAGAPQPFYSYFWEFGDGGFSFEKEPEHIFNDTALVNVRLYATNNYDDGKRPPTRPKPLKTATKQKMLASVSPRSSTFFKAGSSVSLKSNCMPKAGDDMMLVFGYKNKLENGLQNLNGTISILYNDRAFANNNFKLEETRTYNHEQATDLKSQLNIAYIPVHTQKDPIYYASLTDGIITSKAEEKILLKDKVKEFKDQQSWSFKNLKQNEERFVFMHFITTPEMVKDTNAVVRISAVFIPDNPLIETEFFDMELQIVASHDPNKMMLNKTRINYRLTGKNRELTYKIRFQNTGKGPAKKVDIAANISPVFDLSTLRITKTKPEVLNCNDSYVNQSCIRKIEGTDSVHFIFNNIYLPGMQQKGVLDADSTMGFVEYKIKFKEKPKKLPIKSGASIVFDKNEPIYTNRAVGRFKMGLSPGIILGYGFPFETDNKNYLNNKNIVMGASLAPYAPHKYYWQVELYLSAFKENSYVANSVTNGRDTLIGKNFYRIDKKDHIKTTKVITLNAVPLQFRYNINKYIGAGAGTLCSVNVYNKSTDVLNYNLSAPNGLPPLNLEILANESKRHFVDAKVSLFTDVQLGLVHVGPSIGFRYMYDPKTNNNRMATYVTWKF